MITSFLQSSEILNIQLNYFNKALDAAIVHQLPDITFIHGSGNGTLRHELHRLLGKKQPDTDLYGCPQREIWLWGYKSDIKIMSN